MNCYHSNIFKSFSFFLLIFFFQCVLPAAAQETAPESQATPQEASELTVPAEEFDVSLGYNLKVTVRMAPVYQDSSLISEIIDRLPQNSVVGVVSENDTWYRIEFGPQDNRRRGWVISYGVERTHELEHIITSRADLDRWKDQKVIVMAGEAAVRSFPSSGAAILVRAYRNEIFDIVGESEDYYMVQLSSAVRGWISKADVQIYVKPKYSREEQREMVLTASQQVSRIAEIEALLEDLSKRGRTAALEVETLEKRLSEKVESKEKKRGLLLELDSLKANYTFKAGILRQAFGSKLGLSPAMLKGFGIDLPWSEHLALDISVFFGSPTTRPLGAEQPSLPETLTGFDTLSVSSRFWQFGVRYSFGGLKGFPFLKNQNNYLYGGLGIMSLKPSAAGSIETQSLWGPVFGWGFSKRMFKKIKLNIGFSFFLTRADITDVTSSGRSLLGKKKAFLINSGFFGGVNWRF
ncbi:MAG TPA: SH3 domain-containing protein [archaeon]|nr:SH3 domain-containing protein [archaeon]